MGLALANSASLAGQAPRIHLYSYVLVSLSPADMPVSTVLMLAIRLQCSAHNPSVQHRYK